MTTEVHYESDSGEINEVKVDLINDSLSETRPKRYTTRIEERGRVGSLGLAKQVSGNLSRVRGMTPPQLRRGKNTQSMMQPFMSTTNKRALEIKNKVNDKFEGAFGRVKKKKKGLKKRQTSSLQQQI